MPFAIAVGEGGAQAVNLFKPGAKVEFSADFAAVDVRFIAVFRLVNGVDVRRYVSELHRIIGAGVAGIGDKVFIGVVEQRGAHSDAFRHFALHPPLNVIAGFGFQIGVADQRILGASGVAGAEVPRTVQLAGVRELRAALILQISHQARGDIVLQDQRRQRLGISVLTVQI